MDGSYNGTECDRDSRRSDLITLSRTVYLHRSTRAGSPDTDSASSLCRPTALRTRNSALGFSSLCTLARLPRFRDHCAPGFVQNCDRSTLKRRGLKPLDRSQLYRKPARSRFARSIATSAPIVKGQNPSPTLRLAMNCVGPVAAAAAGTGHKAWP